MLSLTPTSFPNELGINYSTSIHHTPSLSFHSFEGSGLFAMVWTGCTVEILADHIYAEHCVLMYSSAGTQNVIGHHQTNTISSEKVYKINLHSALDAAMYIFVFIAFTVQK